MKAPPHKYTHTASPAAPTVAGVLQRKCACGGTVGPTGECAECRRKRLLQPKLRVNQPGDRYEQEADRVADAILRMPDPSANSNTLHIQRLADNDLHRQAKEGNDEERLQTKAASAVPGHAGIEAPPQVHDVLRAPGRPLDDRTQDFMESRLGHDFSAVRIHTDGRASASARSVGARAYTVGRDIVFGSGEYTPGTMAGRRLLAHELTHVVQQGGAGGRMQEEYRVPASSDPEARGTVRLGLRLNTPNVQRQQPAPQQQGVAQIAVQYLQEMATFIADLRRMVALLLRPSGGGQVTAAQRNRAHQTLKQERIERFLQQARTTYNAQVGLLPANDPLRTQLREAYVKVLNEIRHAAEVALTVSEAMPAATRDDERRRYAQNLAAWIEASPMTSAGLADTTAFQQADVNVGRAYEAALEAYLDDLLLRLPGLNLTQAQKDQINNRILTALRRAYVTIAAGPGGTIDVRAISNAQIADKYQRVTALLVGGLSNPPQMNIITDSLPAYQLPNPVPNVTQQLAGHANIGNVDVSHVPADEVASVRYGILQAANTIFPAASTVRLSNAYWPVTLQIRRGGNVVQVRYELVFDVASNVRAERLGPAQPREVAPAFAQLGVAAKKAQLVQDFGLAAVDDRPAAQNRPAKAWTGPELDQVKAAYDLIPQRDRAALHGVTLVRDQQGPAPPGGNVLLGFAHTGASAAHDQPGPPAHGPPHIHYYDAAFAQNAVTSVGPPGATGPGADWTLLHEVGHARIYQASRAANAAVNAANQQLGQAQQALNAAIQGLQVNQAQQQAWNAWNQAANAANQAIVAFNQGVVANPPVAPAQQAQLLQAAQAAVQARNQARPGLAAAGLNQNVVQAATNMDAANDALLAASRQLVAAQDQIPIFVALANRFGFHKFTDYARRGGDPEWFAETYALYLTDPNRLNRMNRSIFRWFEAGMPMNRNWNP